MAPTRAWWWDSRFKQRDDAPPTYRRAPSTPIVSEARGGASFFFSLACARERSAGRRFGNKLTPRERRRVPLLPDTRASRRSTAAIFYTATALLHRTGGGYRSRYPGGICATVHPTSRSHLRQPPHRGRAVTAPPGPWLRATDAGAAPCSANMPPHESALS